MEKKNVKVAISALMEDRSKIDTSLAIQRNFVWKEDTESSLLIDSILRGYPVPELESMVIAEGNIRMILDGKQRFTSIENFYDNKFALDNNILPIALDSRIVPLAGLTYSSLPQELKDRFDNFELKFEDCYDVTPEERDEIFRRLNNGKPLTQIEKTRAMAHGEVVEFLNEISKHPFYAEKVQIADSSKNRFVDTESILQVIAVLMMKSPVNPIDPIDLSGKDLQAFSLKLRDAGGVPADIKEKIKKAADYMNEAFIPTSNKSTKTAFLRKAHLPMLFVQALKAIEKGIKAEIFAQWAKDFFNFAKSGTPYGKAAGSGVATYKNVTIRLTEMGKHFDAHIDKTVIETPANTGKSADKKDDKPTDNKPADKPTTDDKKDDKPAADTKKDDKKDDKKDTTKPGAGTGSSSKKGGNTSKPATSK